MLEVLNWKMVNLQPQLQENYARNSIRPVCGSICAASSPNRLGLKKYCCWSSNSTLFAVLHKDFIMNTNKWVQLIQNFWTLDLSLWFRCAKWKEDHLTGDQHSEKKNMFIFTFAATLRNKTEASTLNHGVKAWLVILTTFIIIPVCSSSKTGKKSIHAMLSVSLLSNVEEYVLGDVRFEQDVTTCHTDGQVFVGSC